jgi:methionyl-tRNA formyltransferase
MRLLLITTSQNAVRKMLSEQEDIDLSVIDCINYFEENFQKNKQSLLCSIERNFALYGPPDVLLTYRCPFIIPSHLYGKARLGAFNIHPSLLPKYKGLNPWEEIFRDHESISGVTLHKITEEIDNGVIVSKKTFLIEDPDTIESARSKADELAKELAKDLVSKLVSDSADVTLSSDSRHPLAWPLVPLRRDRGSGR